MSQSAPAAPDYTGAANSQAAASRDITEQQTWANRPNINTPFGQQTWANTPTWDPTTGQYINSWTQNNNLTPQSQAALDSQMAVTQGKSDLAKNMLPAAQDAYANPMDWSKFDSLAGTPQAAQQGQGLRDFGGTPQANSYTPQNVQSNLDTSGLQNVDSSQKYNQQAGDAIYGQWQSRMGPQMDQQKDQMRTQLYNSGLKEGDQAYDQAMNNLNQTQGQQRNDAQYQATIGSGAEAQRMQGMDLGTNQNQFNQRQGAGAFANSAANQMMQQQLGIGQQQFQEQNSNATLEDQRRAQQGQEQATFGQNNYANSMASANYQNQLRQQQIGEAQTQRAQPLNELNSALNGQQISQPGMPNFTSAQGSSSPNYLGAATQQGQGALNTYNAQQANNNSMYSALGSLAMSFSDRRLKKDIEKLGGPHPKHGLQFYAFRYIWEASDSQLHTGVMADEVEHTGTVYITNGGLLMVDYKALSVWIEDRMEPIFVMPGYELLTLAPAWE
jgi:hypothetical protein